MPGQPRCSQASRSAGAEAAARAWSAETSSDPVVDDDLAREALDFISEHEATLRQPMVLGDPVPTDSSDPLERLLAFCGRDLDR